MNERHIRLIIDIDSRDGHLTGRIWSDGDPARPFTGRLGLLGAIDALVADGSDSADGGATTSDLKEHS